MIKKFKAISRFRPWPSRKLPQKQFDEMVRECMNQMAVIIPELNEFIELLNEWAAQVEADVAGVATNAQAAAASAASALASKAAALASEVAARASELAAKASEVNAKASETAALASRNEAANLAAEIRGKLDHALEVADSLGGAEGLRQALSEANLYAGEAEKSEAGARLWANLSVTAYQSCEAERALAAEIVEDGKSQVAALVASGKAEIQADKAEIQAEKEKVEQIAQEVKATQAEVEAACEATKLSMDQAEHSGLASKLWANAAQVSYKSTEAERVRTSAIVEDGKEAMTAIKQEAGSVIAQGKSAMSNLLTQGKADIQAEKAEILGVTEAARAAFDATYEDVKAIQDQTLYDRIAAKLWANLAMTAAKTALMQPAYAEA